MAVATRLEEEPDAIWMTGPPPQLPFTARGLLWRTVASILIPAAWLAFVVVHEILWAGGFTIAENLAIVVVSLVAVCAVLGVLWVTWAARRGRAR